jgi:hypothetical protein
MVGWIAESREAGPPALGRVKPPARTLSHIIRELGPSGLGSSQEVSATMKSIPPNMSGVVAVLKMPITI